MKRSLFLPIAVLSLTLTGCGMIRGVNPDITPPTETPAIITPLQEDDVPTIVDGKTDINPNTNKIPTTPDNATATCSENIDCQKSEFCYIKTKGEKGSCIKKWDEEGNKVSTEELTKELDAFVDDITKGL